MTGPVFISHSSKDRKIARKICSALENRGLTCWVADRDVGPGENFQEAIVRAIRAAKVMVLVFTENANHSTEIKKELALASRHGLIVIPARAEDAVPSEAFDYEFATRQWINLFENWKDEMERLVTRVSRDSLAADVPPPPARSTLSSPPPSGPSTPGAPLFRPIETTASPSAPPQVRPRPDSSSSDANATSRMADGSGSNKALPFSVRAVGWLLIVQSISRFALWLNALPLINIDYLTSSGSLRVIALGTGAFAAGLLILRRSSKARPFGLATSAIVLLAQIYFFSNALPVYLSGRASNAFFTFSIWVIHPAYLLTFAVALVVLYRWRLARP
jgi:hypothetical protein